MEFKQYINKAWADHAADAKSVFNSFDECKKLIVANENIPIMVKLVTHICGDHLGLWSQGIEILQDLKMNQYYESKTESEISIERAVATLFICSGKTLDVSNFSISNQIRIFVKSSGMILEQGNAALAKEYFSHSLKLVSCSLPKNDPAHLDLAITGNNLACSLELKMNRSYLDTELMILAALAARKFWELAGGSTEVASAEYRLSQSYLQALQIEKSFEHAQLCIEICIANKCSALDFFYGYEAIALAEKTLKNDVGYAKAINKIKIYFEQLSEDDKKWCQNTFNKFYES